MGGPIGNGGFLPVCYWTMYPRKGWTLKDILKKWEDNLVTWQIGKA